MPEQIELDVALIFHKEWTENDRNLAYGLAEPIPSATFHAHGQKTVEVKIDGKRAMWWDKHRIVFTDNGLHAPSNAVPVGKSMAVILECKPAKAERAPRTPREKKVKNSEDYSKYRNEDYDHVRGVCPKCFVELPANGECECA